jgi:hypothetical protein
MNKGCYNPIYNSAGTYKYEVYTGVEKHWYEGATNNFSSADGDVVTAVVLDSNIVANGYVKFDTGSDFTWYKNTSGSTITSGTTTDLTGANWTAGNTIANSTAGCFQHIGTAISRPDDKDCKYVYPDQWIDLRIEANAVSEQDELNRVGTKAKSGQLDGIGGVVATYIVSTPVNTGEYWMYFPTDSDIKIAFDNANVNDFFYSGYVVDYGMVSLQKGADNGDTRFFRVYALDKITLLGNIGNTITMYSTKTIPHPSSGTTLRTDWIGDPANYPQAVKDRLASGLPMIGMNPLLELSTPFGTYWGTNVKVRLGAKVTQMTSVAISTNGSSYRASSYFTDEDALAYYTAASKDDIPINNTIELPYDFANTTDGVPVPPDGFESHELSKQGVWVIPYTAKIPTTQVSDPKAVKLVGNYVTGTNSHSIYKGNQLVPTGKVNVGNGSNGLENRVIENTVEADVNIATLIPIDIYIANPIVTGDIVLNWWDENAPNGLGFYERTSGSSNTWVPNNETFSGWSFVASYPLSTTPTHATIALDDSNSPAVKFIETIAEDDDGMAHYQVFAQEMVSQGGVYGGDTTDELGNGTFTQLINGTLTDDSPVPTTIKTIVASKPLNKYIGDK